VDTSSVQWYMDVLAYLHHFRRKLSGRDGSDLI